METNSMNSVGSPALQRKRVGENTASTDLRSHHRNGNGPVKISTLLEPLKDIIEHPDREKRIAEFFKDYK